MLTVSILIPFHNRLLLTQQGVTSLHKALWLYEAQGNGSFNFSVIAIDDGSTDGSSEWLTEQYPAIHLLKGDGNLWWTGAINTGARYAIEQLKADFVVLWNDDTQCDIRYFVELDKLFGQNFIGQNSILASKIFWLDESDTLFNYGCYYSHRTGQKKLIGLNETDSEQFNQIIPIDWSGGMGTIIPATILTELNYFDAEHFPQYHADIDFFLRANKHGYRAYAIPTLKIYNNRASTGMLKTKNFTDLKNLFLSNRSNYNLKHNFLFNQRHANTVFSWAHFFVKYAVLTSQSVRTIVWS